MLLTRTRCTDQHTWAWPRRNYDQSIARGPTSQSEAELKGVEQLLLKALELDPDLSGAHAELAVLSMQYDRDWDRANIRKCCGLSRTSA